MKAFSIWLIATIALISSFPDSYGATSSELRSKYPCQQSICPILSANHPRAIVFIHGVLSDPFSGWFNEETGAYWPELLLSDPDFEDYDLYTIEYSTNLLERTSSIPETAKGIHQDLQDSDFFAKYQKIYFITHSMGGIIGKDVLVRLSDKELEKIGAILFIATPAKGSGLAGFATWFTQNPQFDAMKDAFKNNFLQELEDSWERLLENREASTNKFPRSFCAYETKNTLWLSVVNSTKAATRCDAPGARGFARDHFGISKPKNKNDIPYPWAKSRIMQARALESQMQPQSVTGIKNAFGNITSGQPLTEDRRGQICQLIAGMAELVGQKQAYVVTLKRLMNQSKLGTLKADDLEVKHLRHLFEDISKSTDTLVRVGSKLDPRIANKNLDLAVDISRELKQAQLVKGSRGLITEQLTSSDRARFLEVANKYLPVIEEEIVVIKRLGNRISRGVMCN